MLMKFYSHNQDSTMLLSNSSVVQHLFEQFSPDISVHFKEQPLR